MKRKQLLILVSLALVLVLFVSVRPVQTLAVDALSIFRVNNLKTIEITMADLQEGMQAAANLKDNFQGTNFEHNPPLQVISQAEHKVTEMTAAEEFKAFRFRLPKELASQKPEISALDSGEIKFSLNVEACNELLKALNNPGQLSGDLNNVTMSLVTPAAAYANYKDLLFMATQKPYLEAPKAAKEEIRDVMLKSPLLPENLRQQLAAIEADSADIYLPVLVGLGREVDLGGQKGYIYTLSDLKAFAGTVQENSGAVSEAHSKYLDSLKGESWEALRAEMREKYIRQYGEEKLAAFEEAHKKALEMTGWENASLLIWTKGGVLYSLIGNKPDAELAKIARSVR